VTGSRSIGEKSGTAAAGLTIAAVVVMLALPSAVLAFATKFEAERTPLTRLARPAPIEGLRADAAGPRLARGRSLIWVAPEPEYPFTFAKNPNRPDRSVTVAVRLDSQALKTITVLAPHAEAAAVSDQNLRLAQSGFNLGVARGYHNFAQEITSTTAVRKIDAPDTNRFSIAPSAQRDDQRDIPRTQFDPGHVPGSFAADKNGPVDLGGALKVTHNLNVTAGVRYAQDNERLLPLTDGNRDNQAVYVGTQLRF
jgi:hypothetical protein